MIKVKDLTVGYDGKIILEDINFKIAKGEMVSVVGPNGSGKSTLLKALSNNSHPERGTILIKDKNIRNYKSQHLAMIMSYLPQVLKVIPQFTVEELVAFGRYPYMKWNNSISSKDKLKIDEALNALELQQMRGRFLTQLSGGERQRARIATTFAQNANILLLDEPATFLDISHQYKIMEILRDYNKRVGKTIITVLHDLNQAMRFSDRIIILNNKKICADGKPEDVLCESALKKVFQIDAEIQNVKEEYKTIIPLNSVKEK